MHASSISRSSSPRGGEGRCAGINAPRVSPGTSSMAMKGRPLLLADVEDGDDVLVGEPAGGPRLTREAVAGHGVEGGAQQLHGH